MVGAVSCQVRARRREERGRGEISQRTVFCFSLTTSLHRRSTEMLQRFMEHNPSPFVSDVDKRSPARVFACHTLARRDNEKKRDTITGRSKRRPPTLRHALRSHFSNIRVSLSHDDSNAGDACASTIMATPRVESTCIGNRKKVYRVHTNLLSLLTKMVDSRVVCAIHLLPSNIGTGK